MRALLLCFCLFASPVLATPTVYLVRHAEKAPNDPKDPDLSDAGRKRAQNLASTLKDAGLTAIYATELKRTQQTAEPLARATGLQVTIVPAAETAALVAQLQEAKGAVLVVGHSNTLPAIVKALGAFAPITLDDAAYDDLFIVTAGAPASLLHLHLPAAHD